MDSTVYNQLRALKYLSKCDYYISLSMQTMGLTCVQEQLPLSVHCHRLKDINF